VDWTHGASLSLSCSLLLPLLLQEWKRKSGVARFSSHKCNESDNFFQGARFLKKE
jgi:hypothetical protein